MLLLGIATLALPAVAEATCAPQGPELRVLFPAHGAVDLPTNVAPFFAVRTYGGEYTIQGGELRDDLGGVIPGTVVQRAHHGQDPATLEVYWFQPDTELNPLTSYTLYLDANGELAGPRFTTGLGPDLDPPPPPQELRALPRSYNAAIDYNCRPAVWTIDFAWSETSGSDAVTYLIDGSLPLPKIEFIGQNLTPTQSPGFLNLGPGGTADITVCAIDAAGHESCSDPLPYDVPGAPDFEGRSPPSTTCALTGTDSRAAMPGILMLLAFAAVALRRRR